MEAVPKSIQALEAGRAVEAEGYVFEAHMLRGLELEAMRQKAEHSWNRALGALGGAEGPSRAERMELTDSDSEQDPEDFQRASDEETAAAATAAAAEHSQDARTPELASQEVPDLPYPATKAVTEHLLACSLD